MLRQVFPTHDDQEFCARPLPPEALIGIECFNRQEFFEAHEHLETAWRDEPTPVRELYRGILQVAVTYYHIERGNYPGARKLLNRCWAWLAPFAPSCQGIQLDQLRSDLDQIQTELERCELTNIADFNRNLFHPIKYSETGEQ